jgi:hypothetical protein
MGFAVAGEVTGVNELPGENQRLRGERRSLSTERDSLLETIASDWQEHAGRVDHYLAAIGRLEFQNKRIIESLTVNPPIVTTLGPWLHEE